MKCIQAEHHARKVAERLAGKLLISGQLCVSDKDEVFDVVDPATTRLICRMPQAQTKDIELAVCSAEQAYLQWSRLDAGQRGSLLVRCAELLELHTEELAQLVTLETGKAIRTESRPEANVFTSILRYYAGLALELKGYTTPLSHDTLTFTLREPIGVVGAIIPWNVPLALMALKVAPALVAGNVVVLKSSEEAPLAVLRAAELMNQILPPGVLNVISGDGASCGAALVGHPGILKVTFTGSVESGRLVYQQAAAKLIPVSLELGGKSPMIVCEDADLDQAVEGAVTGMRFTRQGQSCTAASRILVHASLMDEFIDRLVSRLNTMKIGNPFDEQTDIGAIISRKQYDAICGFIELGKSHPLSSVRVCSQLPKDMSLINGYFLQPHILSDLPHTHTLCQQEIFGPVTCVLPWKCFDEVMTLANSTCYGLAATLWTRDIQKALQGVKRLQAGVVQVNQNWVVRPGLAFGGYKVSGLGKEAGLETMLEHYTRSKTVILNASLA